MICNTIEQKKITQLELLNLKILMQLAIVAATDSGQKSDRDIFETEDAHTIHTFGKDAKQILGILSLSSAL